MTSFLKSVAAVSIVSMATAVPALAQQAAPTSGTTMPMQGMTMPMKPGATPDAPTPGTTMPMQGMTMPMKPGATPDGSMMSAMDRMSKDMAAVPMTGDADRDFVGMMLPHHQGAIDMAKYELAHGKDPAMLKLARAIVAAQDKEVAEMKSWQAKHPAGR